MAATAVTTLEGITRSLELSTLAAIFLCTENWGVVMEDEAWETLRGQAADLVARVRSEAGAPHGESVEWGRIAAGTDTSPSYWVDQQTRTVWLNRDTVSAWFEESAKIHASARFEALALRAGAALIFAPPAYDWHEAAGIHLRWERDQGLDEDYPNAFRVANDILESQRLDQRLLELLPDRGATMAELVTFDLAAYPTFETYSRAAIILGRPHLPADCAQPAFDEFVETFGIEEADDLRELLNYYVALDQNSVLEMVEATAKLVYQAFPEALGLVRTDGEDELPLIRNLPDNMATDWGELEHFVASTLALFTGKAGLDFGDALIIGLRGAGVIGPHIAAWAQSPDITLDLCSLDLRQGAIEALLGRGWEPYDNAPESFHKSVPAAHADQTASELIWVLRELSTPNTVAGIALRGRGPAEDVAKELGWTTGNPRA